MIIAVSGYNATGKTTLVRALADQLEQHKIPHKLVKFEKLYLGTWLKPKRRQNVAGPKTRSAEGHRMRALRNPHDRRFRWQDFGNIASAVMAVWLLRLFYVRKVVVLERFFYDRFIFFNPDSRLYRLAMRVVPRPQVLFMLLPHEECWQQRFLDRLRRQTGSKVDELPEADIDELKIVRQRYETFHQTDADIVLVDSTAEDGIERAWSLLHCRLRDVTRAKAKSSAGMLKQ